MEGGREGRRMNTSEGGREAYLGVLAGHGVAGAVGVGEGVEESLE